MIYTARGPQKRHFDINPDKLISIKESTISKDSNSTTFDSTYGTGRYPSTSSRILGTAAGNSPTLNESSIRGGSCRSRRFDSDESSIKLDSRRSDSTRAGSARSANNDSSTFVTANNGSSTFVTANNDSSTFASDDSSYGNGRYPSTSSRYRPGGNSPTLNESSIRSDSRRSNSTYAGPARSGNNDSSTLVTSNNDSSTFASDDSSYGNGRYPSTSSRYPNRPGGNSPSLNESSIRSYGASTSSRKSSSSPGYSLDVSRIDKAPKDDDVFLPSSRAGKVPPRKRLDFSSAASMDSSSELSPGYSPKNGNQQMLKKKLSVDQLPTDEYVGSQKVANLNKTNFYDLLGSKDITLVFFYDPRNPESALYKDNIKQASGCTKRANHAFAAVNCKTSKDLCLQAGVLKAPMLKLYSGLKPIEDIKNSKTTADDIRRTVEQG